MTPAERALLITLSKTVLELSQLKAQTLSRRSPLLTSGHWKMRVDQLADIVRVLEATT